MLAVLLALLALPALPAPAAAQPLQPGQTVIGTLDAGSPVWEDRYVAVYEAAFREGEALRIQVESEDFEPFVLLLDGEANPLALGESYQGGAALLRDTPTFTGLHLLVVGPMDPAGFGEYTLSIAVERSLLGGDVSGDGEGTGSPGGTAPQPAGGQADTAAAQSPGTRELAIGETVSGRLGPDSDLFLDELWYADLWHFSGEAGQEVIIRLESASFDAWLNLLVDGEQEELTYDDDSGGGTDAAMQLVLPYTGRYSVLVSTYYILQGGDYRLSVEAVEPPTPRAGRSVLQMGESRTGVLGPASDRLDDEWYLDRHRFAGRAGQQVLIRLDSSHFHGYLELYDEAEQQQLAYNSDARGGTTAQIVTALPYTGFYTVWVTSSWPREAGAYTVSVQAVDPGVQGDAAGRLRVGQAVSGRLGPESGRYLERWFADRYELEGEAGQEVVLWLTSEDFDAALFVFDDAEEQQLAYDNDGGGGTDAGIRLTLPFTGRYTVMVTSDMVGEQGAYVLSAETPGPRARTALAGKLMVGEAVEGVLGPYSPVTAAGRPVAHYTFYGDEGEKVVIQAESINFDVFLALFGQDAELLAADDDSAGGLDALLRHTLPYTGVYRLLVVSYEGGGVFRLSLQAEE